jgi:acyl-CoA thioesterase-1
MKNFTVYFLLLLVIGCSQEQNIESKPVEKTKNYTVLALGDSLTEGLGVKQSDNYPSILEKFLPDNIQVINAGLSGETSSGLKSRLNWVLTQKPDLIILNIGANDAMRGLPLELTLTNIDQIINTIKLSNADVILAGMQIYDNLGKEYVNGFSEIYPQLAKKHNLLLIPFFLEGVAGDPRFNQADMLHPNAQGYKIIVEKNILPTLNTYLKKQNL